MALTHNPSPITDRLILNVDGANPKQFLSYTNTLIQEPISYSANQNVTISTDVQTSGGSSITYTKCLINQTGSTPGIYPINGNIEVLPNTQYLLEVNGYKSGSNTVTYYVLGNQTNTAIIDAYPLPSSDGKVSCSFNTGSNTSIRVGFLSRSHAIGDSFFIRNLTMRRVVIPDILNQYDFFSSTAGSNTPVLNSNGYFEFDGTTAVGILGSDLPTTPLNTTYNGKTIELAFWMDPTGFTYSGSPFYRAMLGGPNFVENRSFNTYIYTTGVNQFGLHWSYGNGVVNSGPSAAISVSTGTWYILTISVDSSGTSVVYLNGTQVSGFSAGAAHSKGYNVQTGALQYIGYADNFWYGRIGYCRIYAKNLSASEVLHNFNVSKSRFGL
jgi:hypothetical protein